jgi:hypothetical protein
MLKLPISNAVVQGPKPLPRSRMPPVISKTRMGPLLVDPDPERGLKTILDITTSDFISVNLDLIHRSRLGQVVRRSSLLFSTMLLRFERQLTGTKLGKSEFQFGEDPSARPLSYRIGAMLLMTTALLLIISLQYAIGNWFDTAGYNPGDDDLMHKVLPTLIASTAGVIVMALMLEQFETDGAKTRAYQFCAAVGCSCFFLWLFCVAKANGIVAEQAALPGRRPSPDAVWLRAQLTIATVVFQLLGDCAASIAIKGYAQAKLDGRYRRRFAADGAFQDLKRFVREAHYEWGATEYSYLAIMAAAEDLAATLKAHLGETAAIYRARVWELESMEREAREDVRRRAAGAGR